MSLSRTLALRYGHDRLECTVSADADILEIREPERAVSRESFLAGVNRLLPPAVPQGSVGIVVADKTRLCGYPQTLPWLTTALRDWGVDRARIAFYIAYGTHAPQSEAESLNTYGPTYARYPFIHHRSTAPTRFAELGRTTRGTPVRIRADLLDAGLIITMGAISHHYFAGFGGGRKLLFPGLGEKEAIYRNHRLFLDAKQRILALGCRPGQLDANPLAEDLAEIDHMLPPYRSIHGLLDSQGEVAAYRFGTGYDDFLTVCREHDVFYRAKSSKRYDLVLASAGGYPKDINMIQAHKAIDNAAAFVRDGGTLIVLAECADGIGSSTFLPYFEMGGWTVAFDHLAGEYSGNGGTALAMMAKTGRIRIALVTALDEHLCRKIGTTKISIEEASRRAIDAGEVAVIPNASMLIRGAPAT